MTLTKLIETLANDQATADARRTAGSLHGVPATTGVSVTAETQGRSSSMECP